MLAHRHPEDVLELGDEDVHGGSGGVAAHQWVREVGHHEAELQEAQGKLKGRRQKWLTARGPGPPQAPFPARLGPLTWKMPVRTVMVATSSTRAASLRSSLTVMLLPLMDSRKFSLGSRESVKLPIMTEMTAKGPGDRQGAQGQHQELSELPRYLCPWAGLTVAPTVLWLWFGQPPPRRGKVKAREVPPNQ